MYFPLDVMFELKHSKQIDKVGFEDFIRKALSFQYEVVVDALNESLINTYNKTLTDEVKDSILNIPIYIGNPDELTNTEFLNKLYANLNLTGQEGPYRMYQEMKKYQELINQKEYHLIYLENLSENVIEMFEHCSLYPNNCYKANIFFGSYFMIN